MKNSKLKSDKIRSRKLEEFRLNNNQRIKLKNRREGKRK